MNGKRIAAGMLLLIAVAACLPVLAEPVLSFGPLSAALGESVVLSLRIDGAVEPCMGVNATFSLPAGVSLAGVAPGELLSDAFKVDSYSFTQDPGNKHSVIAYAISDTFLGEAGVLFYLTVAVSTDPAEVGLDTAEVVRKEVAFHTSGLASSDGKTSLAHAALGAVMTLVREPQPFLAVSPATRDVPAAGSQTSFAVENAGNADMAWTAELVDSPAWLTISSGATGFNSGTVVVDCQRNTAAASRTATVLIDAGNAQGSPATVTVVQAGDTTPALAVSPSELMPPYSSGIADISIENTGNGTLNWTARVVEGIDWLAIASGAAGSGNGMATVAYQANFTPASRTGRVEIAAPGAAGSPAYISVVQAAPPVLSVAPVTQTVGAPSAAIECTVANLGSGSMAWSAEVISGVEWLQITSGDSGVNAGVIALAVAENTGETARSGLVRVRADGALYSPVDVQVTQAAVNIPALSVLPLQRNVSPEDGFTEFTVANLGSGTMLWQAALVSGEDWASITSGASGTNTGIVEVSFSANASSAWRSAVVRVSAEGAEGSPVDVTVTQRAAETVRVGAPNGGEDWCRGNEYTIEWSTAEAESKAVKSVSLVLLKGGNVLRFIALTVANTGSYTFTVPADLEPADDYKIQVIDVEDAAAHDESDGCFSISTRPAVPANLVASDGLPNAVYLSWDPAFEADRYEVLRSEQEDPQTAVQIGVSESNSYEDHSAAAPGDLLPGCSGLLEREVRYFYWVRSVNVCWTSELSEPDDGYRGKDVQDPKTGTIIERALPSPLSQTTSSSPLAVRLCSEEGIDVATIRCAVDGVESPHGAFEWIPVEVDASGAPLDGWVVVSGTAWSPGAAVEVTVAASTVAGLPVEPLTRQFQISDGTASKEIDALWQPACGEQDAAGPGAPVEVTEFAGVPWAPALSGGVGVPYQIGPDQPFSQPRRVWLPLPIDTAPGRVSLYYYHAGAESGWYAAENVQGWLVPGSELQLEVNGVVYVGFLVRHGAVVQWAEPVEPSGGAASAGILPLPRTLQGDMLLLAMVVLWLAAGPASRTYRRRARRS